MIPPEQNAELVACMEDVLEVYQRPYDPKRPVVCLDEQPTQLIGETRRAIPHQPGQPQRDDCEYALDVAEIELSVFTKQCLSRRIAHIETLKSEAKAWADARNEAQTGVDWQFTNDQARTKLKHPYPQVKVK